MENIPLSYLFSALVVLVCCSAFFSGSETGIMAINRYKLRHASKEDTTAKVILNLLKKPDKLLGVILIGNTFANILASSIATVIGIRLWQDFGIIAATISLTLIVLIFAEILPKTIAAIYPEKIAYPTAYPLRFILFLLYPVVYLATAITNGILAIFGVKIKASKAESLSQDELRSVVTEASPLIPASHKKMLLSILELEQQTVEDIMVVKNDIIGIDISSPIDDIIKQLQNTQHTVLPVFNKDIDEIIGVLHVRNVIQSKPLTLEDIKEALDEPYFVPETAKLNVQLINFQKNNERFGLVIDEYGDIQGLVTLEDILEEIVGEFTTDFAAVSKDIHRQTDGSYLIDGSATIREIIRSTNIKLPTDGPKTLSGLIIEYLETIPNVGTCIKINNYPIEVVQVMDNMVKTAKIYPAFV